MKKFNFWPIIFLVVNVLLWVVVYNVFITPLTTILNSIF